jgi:adenine-specific DNA-methyltransferase
MMDCADVMDHVEQLRSAISHQIDNGRKSELGQFFTPRNVAQLMASMIGEIAAAPRLLDAGAGIGALSAAAVTELRTRLNPPSEIFLVAYEIDKSLIPHLDLTLRRCATECSDVGIRLEFEIRNEDFLIAACDLVGESLFGFTENERFDCALLNPPYIKIGTDSIQRRALNRIGIPVSNAYAGFVGAVMRMLTDGGRLVAITPRSFCNGPYFKPFRKALLRELRIDRLHVFRSRADVFSLDAVLQENVIVSAFRGSRPRSDITISSSSVGCLDDVESRAVDFNKVIRPDDPDSFVRVLEDQFSEAVDLGMSQFRTTLSDLGLDVSTGRVVDFRVREHLRAEPSDDAVPLIFPGHLHNGAVKWPRPGFRKANAIAANDETKNLLVANGVYVLVKRFSAKEERRRVVASVHRAEGALGQTVGFENHLNYVHQNGNALPLDLARGLAAFFNSTLFDVYFRQFSGHTQVNAADLRNLNYPTRSELAELGATIGDEVANQEAVDDLIAKLLKAAGNEEAVFAMETMKRVDEALQVLRELGFPKAQLNERSALMLLALLALKPGAKWSTASQPLMGVTPLMDFFAKHYGKKYAPNTRETVRRQTIHQFLDAGLIVANPDEPDRPVNSGKNVYQVTDVALALVRAFGTRSWTSKLAKYLANVETLKSRYAKERKMSRIPIRLSGDTEIALSPGRHNTDIAPSPVES